jgi:hypothetical protein
MWTQDVWLTLIHSLVVTRPEEDEVQDEIFPDQMHEVVWRHTNHELEQFTHERTDQGVCVSWLFWTRYDPNTKNVVLLEALSVLRRTQTTWVSSSCRIHKTCIKKDHDRAAKGFKLMKTTVGGDVVGVRGRR